MIENNGNDPGSESVLLLRLTEDTSDSKLYRLLTKLVRLQNVESVYIVSVDSTEFPQTSGYIQ